MKKFKKWLKKQKLIRKLIKKKETKWMQKTTLTL